MTVDLSAPESLRRVAMRMLYATPVGRVCRYRPAEFQREVLLALGGRVAEEPKSWLIFAAALVITAVSRPAALVISPLAPGKRTVDHSVTGGRVSKVKGPAPPDGT